MKQFTSLILSGLLAACCCHTPRPTISATSVNLPALNEPATQSEGVPATSQPQPAKNVSAASPQITTQNTASSKPTTAAIAHSPASDTMTSTTESIAKQKDSSSVFTPQAAAVVIARDRANQTLNAVQPDTAAFKKESILPTQGRLLSPLAYEPVLPDHTNAPWSNENLQYGLYYSFVKAGTAYIKTRGLVSKNGKTAYLIQTTAFSASVIDSVFKVRDVNYSWIDIQSLHSLGYSQSVREGNYKRDEWLSFDNENGRFYGEIQKKNQPRVIAGELDQEVLDMLSSLYYVRAKPLEAGKDVVFDIVNREKQYPLIVKVLGKETVKTPAGKFNCWVVEPQIRGEGIFVAKGKSLKVWLTDDMYRMPVKMSVEVFIGSVSAELLAYTRN